MSDNFYPKMWSDRTLDRMIKELQTTQHMVNAITDYTHLVKGKEADAYIGLKIGSLDYVNMPASDSDVNRPTKSTIQILFDQKKGVPFEVDNIENAQSNINFMTEFAIKAKDGLIKAYDDFILGKIISDSGSKILKSKSNNKITFEDILELKLRLDEAQAPETKRFLVVSPKTLSHLLSIKEFISRDKIADANAMKSGIIGQILGFNVMMLPYIPKVDSTGAISATPGNNTLDVVLAFQSIAFGFGRQQEFGTKIEPKALSACDWVNIWSVFGGTMQEPTFAVTMRDNAPEPSTPPVTE